MCESGVDILSSEETISKQGALDMVVIQRFSGSTSKTAAAPSPSSGQQAHPEEWDKKVAHLTQMLQHHMQQQHLFWEFSNNMFSCQKRTFEHNNFKKALPYPQFLDEILVPFKAPQSVLVRPSLSTHSLNNNDISSNWSPPRRSPTPLTQPNNSRKGKWKILDNYGEATQAPVPKSSKSKSSKAKTASTPAKRKKMRDFENATFLLDHDSEETEDNLPIIGRAGPALKPKAASPRGRGKQARKMQK